MKFDPVKHPDGYGKCRTCGRGTAPPFYKSRGGHVYSDRSWSRCGVCGKRDDAKKRCAVAHPEALGE